MSKKRWEDETLKPTLDKYPERKETLLDERDILDTPEDSSLSNVITMDGGKINNLADGLNKSSSMENNSIINNETSKDSNSKKPKRRRRKNTKFRKFDNNTEENHPYNNFEGSKETSINEKKSEDENNNIEERDTKKLNKEIKNSKTRRSNR